MTSHNNDVTEPSQGSSTAATLDEQGIVDYLRRNPDFFHNKPSLLSDLRIPHDAGGAVSLVERQIRVLREASASQQKQLDGLIQIAHENSRLSEQLHQMTVAVMQCDDLDVLLALLEDTLCKDFSADRVAVSLLCNPVQTTQATRDEFVRDKVAFTSLFQHLLQAGRPYCGRLKTDQLSELFGDPVEQVGSTAILPLGDRGQFGLLSICSYDRNRFTATADTAFLGRMSEIISAGLARFLQHPSTQSNQA